MKKLPENPADALAILDEEAISKFRKNGGVDHHAAARHVRSELARLEAGGITWAGQVRLGAEDEGHAKRIGLKLKRRKSMMPTSGGDTVLIPAAYARKKADGSVQMTLWYELPIAELNELIADLEAQAGILNQRSSVMRYGRELARRHGVDSALAGFAAEGIDITGEVAA